MKEVDIKNKAKYMKAYHVCKIIDKIILSLEEIKTIITYWDVNGGFDNEKLKDFMVRVVSQDKDFRHMDFNAETLRERFNAKYIGWSAQYKTQYGVKLSPFEMYQLVRDYFASKRQEI